MSPCQLCKPKRKVSSTRTHLDFSLPRQRRRRRRSTLLKHLPREAKICHAGNTTLDAYLLPSMDMEHVSRFKSGKTMYKSVQSSSFFSLSSRVCIPCSRKQSLVLCFFSGSACQRACVTGENTVRSESFSFPLSVESVDWLVPHKSAGPGDVQQSQLAASRSCIISAFSSIVSQQRRRARYMYYFRTPSQH